MRAKMPGSGDIKVKIGPDGLEYKERGTIGWLSEEIGWNEIDSVKVNDVSVHTTASEAGGYPIELEGNITIGTNSEENEAGKDGESSFYEDLFSETGIAVDIEAERVAFDPERNQTENFVDFFAHLFESGHASKNDLPFRTNQQKNYILNTEPSHPTGEMKRGAEVVDGVWVETSVPVNQKKHHILQAAKHFIE